MSHCQITELTTAFSYRLGIFGFLASDALKEDNKAAGDEGVGNYGVRDQILAFEWVAKNIKSFGGDPSRITAVGQSAGSSTFSLMFHIDGKWES